MRKITNRKNIKIAVITGIVLFFGILFIYNLAKIGTFRKDSHTPTVLNDRVVFEQPKLAIFDETKYINQFPDTIHIHYPYFIVVVPEDTKQITTVYSFTQKKQIAAFNDVVLDYNNGNFLYNYHGGNTYFKGENLQVHCNQGFIKSATDILCVTQNEANPLYSDLININPKTHAEKTLYSPQDAITAVYYSNNTLYIGEYNYDTHQAYITKNGNRTKINTFVSIIYQMKNNLYIGTIKNDNDNLIASYSLLISNNGQLSSVLQSKGEIVFY